MAVGVMMARISHEFFEQAAAFEFRISRIDPERVTTVPRWAAMHENVKNRYRRQVTDGLEAMGISVDFQGETPVIDEWPVP